jgi:N5-(cytidine 5'-diphosphoramidyl)-L-glutamine hydrolase
MNLRIGVTMRVDKAPGYEEWRDGLSEEWMPFLNAAIPEAAWLPIPNFGSSVLAYVKQWNLKGFLLTGGNDLHSSARRDQTETVLLEHALSESLPLFGVCRGMQVVGHYFGSALASCPERTHIATRHPVLLSNPFPLSRFAGSRIEVNSFHGFGIRKESLSPDVKAIAVTEDDWVEGLRHKNGRILAVMWHPERQAPVSELDRHLLRFCFGLENGDEH